MQHYFLKQQGIIAAKSLLGRKVSAVFKGLDILWFLIMFQRIVKF